ncbi:MAG TPA: hypothetical protein DHU69_06220 [Deltaproteobacteria bacterium]|nr:hypothetical protein [Deltaproteobacteria bacterium]HCY19339.1 hypothetical protein [Deltaproteobacteria bacterium]
MDERIKAKGKDRGQGGAIVRNQVSGIMGKGHKKIFLVYIFLFLLFPSALSLASVVNAEIIDKVIAVVNDSVITLSELNSAIADIGIIKGDSKEKQIVETKSRILDQLIEKKLVELAATKAGISVSEKEIDNAVEDVKKQNNISHEELLRALAKNGLTLKAYREQLKEQVRQVKFINRQFRSNIKLADEDVEAYYKLNQDKFAGPTMHRLRIISFPLTEPGKVKEAEKKVKDVLAMAKRGEDFAKLAREYSQGPNALGGGDLGYVKTGEMDPTIERAIAGLKSGEVSDVVKTSTGFHIIQVVERPKGEPRPLSEVDEEIRNIIFQKIIDERYKFWLEEIMKKAYVEVRL